MFNARVFFLAHIKKEFKNKTKWNGNKSFNITERQSREMMFTVDHILLSYLITRDY